MRLVMQNELGWWVSYEPHVWHGPYRWRWLACFIGGCRRRQ